MVTYTDNAACLAAQSNFHAYKTFFADNHKRASDEVGPLGNGYMLYNKRVEPAGVAKME